MPQFIIQFAHYHEDFRLAELHALSELEGVAVIYDKDGGYSAGSPILLVKIESAAKAAKLVRRAILIRSVC
ncbi:hypothetical protein EV175_003283, partial [Coemansia sp. RSA 1933]